MNENLFLSAMGADKVKEIETIKSNKAFALRLINELDKVFKIFYEIQDEQNSVTIKIKKAFNHNWYGSISLVANVNGIKFNGHNLGYYTTTQFKPLGKLYEKYKETSKADSGFLSEHGHGHCFISFFVSENDPMLMDKLNDIIYLMEQNHYNKVF
jgi:hypothetical protein